MLVLPPLSAASDYYQTVEVPVIWDGTDGNQAKPPTSDYDYTYGDDDSISYTLPWSVNFFGNSFRQITVDTNGSIWFGGAAATNSFSLSGTGRGPVIAAWNSDLSSNYYGGVFVQWGASSV